MARSSGRSVGGARPNLLIMDEAMSYPAQPEPWSARVDKHGNVTSATIEPFNAEDVRLTREAWRHLSQSPRNEQMDIPSLVVRQAEIPSGATVMVMWGENRFMVGVVTGKSHEGSYFVKHLDGPGKGGLFIAESLGVVLSEAPQFASVEEAEDWLMRSGEQEWFPGDIVRVSERRDRESMIQHGKVVKYLGIQGKEPPKYLVEIHGEPKIVASYFIKGRA